MDTIIRVSHLAQKGTDLERIINGSKMRNGFDRVYVQIK